MSEEKTPDQVAQEAQESLHKIIAMEAQKLAQQHINIVQLRIQAVQLSLKFFENGFDESIFPVSEAMLKFLASGEYKKPEENLQ